MRTPFLLEYISVYFFIVILVSPRGLILHVKISIVIEDYIIFQFKAI